MGMMHQKKDETNKRQAMQRQRNERNQMQAETLTHKVVCVHHFRALMQTQNQAGSMRFPVPSKCSSVLAGALLCLLNRIRFC